MEEAAAEAASRKASIWAQQARAARIAADQAADQAEEEEDIKLVDPEVLCTRHAAVRYSAWVVPVAAGADFCCSCRVSQLCVTELEALPLPVVLIFCRT